jgi:hypothetical protein
MSNTKEDLNTEIPMQKNMEESAEDLNTDQNTENSSFQKSETEPLTEIQNITIPLKRKDDLIDNFHLKFVKCSNITINITK